MSSYKSTIASLLSNSSHVTEAQQKTFEKIEQGVLYAWNNWDAGILATYYTGEKPEEPTAAFVENWVDNEDFDADGYDVEHLKELFA